MSDNIYQLKLNFCQLTLDELKNPYVHIKNGCQFNLNQDDQQILRYCPVCKSDINKQNNNKNDDDKIQQDDQLLIQLEQKNEGQLVYNKTNNTLFFMKRRNYTHDIISKKEEVKDLQKSFYSDLIKKRITLQKIQEISQQRNQQYISCLKNFSDSQKIPILMAVINHRLILFYHLYKLKVELTLLDVTTPKIRQRVGLNYGILQQMMLVENNIYFLYLKQNVSTLFIGDFQQIFIFQNTDEIQFQIKQMPIFKLDGPSKLIYTKDKELIMMGNRQYFNITKQTNLPYANFLDSMTINTLSNYFDNNQILMVNQEEDRQINKKNLLFFCYDLSKPNYLQDPKNTSQIFTVKQKFDNFFSTSDKILLFQTQELNKEKCQITSITSWLSYAQQVSPMTFDISIINHQSYMQPTKVVSTQKCMNNITCLLIGMRLPRNDFQQPDDESDVFPALLVYNHQASSFEVELI
ncbi:unnamed protein product [Paramecium pentaurelia]|uniref:Uncharacterized protein n=1 Tax=Paramecium pentaurelia TaxID=43138 RepID=A0A8S1TS13_9CILI|nr:unnamed protein product [Paramecium pentaurelia]